MTDREQRQLCKECKTKTPETECYEHFKMSGRSSLPSIKSHIIPKYCKFNQKEDSNE